jgi:hypothetical protein
MNVTSILENTATLLFVVIFLLTYLHIMRLDKTWKVAQRAQRECGSNAMEMETVRYQVDLFMRKTQHKLHSIKIVTVVLGTVSMLCFLAIIIHSGNQVKEGKIAALGITVSSSVFVGAMVTIMVVFLGMFGGLGKKKKPKRIQPLVEMLAAYRKDVQTVRTQILPRTKLTAALASREGNKTGIEALVDRVVRRMMHVEDMNSLEIARNIFEQWVKEKRYSKIIPYIQFDEKKDTKMLRQAICGTTSYAVSNMMGILADSRVLRAELLPFLKPLWDMPINAVSEEFKNIHAREVDALHRLDPLNFPIQSKEFSTMTKKLIEYAKRIPSAYQVVRTRCRTENISSCDTYTQTHGDFFPPTSPIFLFTPDQSVTMHFTNDKDKATVSAALRNLKARNLGLEDLVDHYAYVHVLVQRLQRRVILTKVRELLVRFQNCLGKGRKECKHISAGAVDAKRKEVQQVLSEISIVNEDTYNGVFQDLITHGWSAHTPGACDQHEAANALSNLSIIEHHDPSDILQPRIRKLKLTYAAIFLMTFYFSFHRRFRENPTYTIAWTGGLIVFAGYAGYMTSG